VKSLNSQLDLDTDLRKRFHSTNPAICQRSNALLENFAPRHACQRTVQ
jgi:hypothetical protein